MSVPQSRLRLRPYRIENSSDERSWNDGICNAPHFESQRSYKEVRGGPALVLRYAGEAKVGDSK
jgi:hypothetical protein